MRNLYRGPDRAYSSMDFSGIGFITEEDFLKSIVASKCGFSEVELRDFVYLEGMFKGEGMNFDSFKKTFFPHLYLIKEGEEEEDEKNDMEMKKQMRDNKEKQHDIIAERLKKLEKLLKIRFSNNWDSVRKAFLGLDTDYDGYITVEDILRYFG